MGFLGDMNLANYLKVIRAAKPNVGKKYKLNADRDRNKLVAVANGMVAKSHAYARQIETEREDVYERACSFVDDFESFIELANRNELLCYKGDFKEELESATKLVRDNIKGICDYFMAIPTIFYYDSVTKNFPLEEVDETRLDSSLSDRVVRLPRLDAGANLREKCLLYAKYLREELKTTRDRVIPVKGFLVNSVDRCRLKREPGVSDIANLYLTSVFNKRDDEQDAKQLRKDIRAFLWEYILEFGEGVSEYNVYIDGKDKDPKSFLMHLIQQDIDQRFMFFLCPGTSKDTMVDIAKDVQGLLSGLKDDLNFKDYFFEIFKSDLPEVAEKYFCLLERHVGFLEPKENTYWANSGYKSSVDISPSELRKGLEDNSTQVLDRFKEIEADLYCSMFYRAIMIANTVPTYVSQNRELNGDRVGYYKVEIGAALQAVRILREDYIEGDKAPYLRVPLKLDEDKGLEKGLETMYKLVSNLKPGKITRK